MFASFQHATNLRSKLLCPQKTASTDMTRKNASLVPIATALTIIFNLLHYCSYSHNTANEVDKHTVASSRYRQKQHFPLPPNCLPATQSPLPLAQLPLVEQASVRSEVTKATPAVATAAHRHRPRQHSRRPRTSRLAHQSPPPLPRLLLPFGSGYR